jgi:integrase
LLITGLEAGVPVEVVSKRLGHSRISTTLDLYVHPDEAQQRAASDVFERMLDEG